MINTVLSRNIRHLRTPVIASRLSYQSVRAASVNSGIARGLRKSKGVGFRGRERGANFETKEHGSEPKNVGFRGRESATSFEKKGFNPRDKPVERNGSGHRTSEPRGFQPRTNRPQMSREGWPGRSSKQDSNRGQETRIYKGNKPIKTDLQLARKKPNPAGSSRNGGYISGTQSVERVLSRSERGSSEFQRPQFAGPMPEKPQRGFEGRSGKAFFNSGSNEAGDQPRVKNIYPSLSFGKPKFQKHQTESGRTEGFHDRQTQLHTRGRYPEQEQGPASRQRQSYSGDRSCERRSQESGSADGYVQRSSTKRYESMAEPRNSTGLNMNVRRSESSGKYDEDASTTRPRIINPMDSRIPLSITYTTPASEFLYGTSVVEAALRSTRIPRRQHYKFYICAGENRENIKKDAEMERLARNNQVEVVKMNGDGLRLMDKMSGGRPHNGYILEASPLPRLPVASMGELTSKDNQFGFEVSVESQSREQAAVNGTSTFVRIPTPKHGRKPMVLLLDKIVDPGNLGGILRTASFLGVSAVAISIQGSATFSPVVLKASAGASENIPILSVRDPAGFVRDSKQAGWKVFAAVAPSPSSDSFKPVSSQSIDDLYDPLSEDSCILMVGGEGYGLPKFLRSKADVELYIPSSGRNRNVDSLNVSVATGILCNAFLSKRQAGRAPTEGQESHSADRLF